MIFPRKTTFSRKPEANRSLDRCKCIRTRSDKVEVFQTAENPSCAWVFSGAVGLSWVT